MQSSLKSSSWSEKPYWSTNGLDWINIAFLIVTPIVGVAGVIYWISQGWASAWNWGNFVLQFTLSGIAITAGYHRYYAHRTYEANVLLRIYYLVFGSAAFQNSVLNWASSHRYHHRHVDTEGDPYNIKKGFFWAHMGWIFYKDPIERTYENSMDLMRDPLVQWQNKYNVPLGILSGFIFPMFLGYLYGDMWGGLIFGGIFRAVVTHHSTFLVNSAAHYFGSQPHDTETTARNSWWLPLLTWGEGYHNWHHKYASDYRNGPRWYHFDPGKWWIASFSIVRMTKKLSRVKVKKKLNSTSGMDQLA